MVGYFGFSSWPRYSGLGRVPHPGVITMIRWAPPVVVQTPMSRSRFSPTICSPTTRR